MTVWLNGGFVDAGAPIDASDRGFLLGDGVFETIYVEDGRCAFFREHMRRLTAGLAALQIPAPHGLDALASAIAELAARESLSKGRAAARITVTRGPSARGLRFADPAAPTVLVTLAPLGTAPKKPLRLHISARPRFSGASTGAFKAIGGYIENMLAHNEALAAGADEAVMLNEKGRVACAAAANIFLIGEAGVATPPAAEGALAGVVRGAILKGAKEIGVAVTQRPISPDELDAGDLVLTNSLIGLKAAVMAAAPPPRKGAPARRLVLKALQSWYDDRLTRELAKRSRP
jgi:branched-chain amino acid aminotransferase